MSSPAATPSGDIHGLAVEAEQAVEQLATQLAHAGVPPQAVQEVTQCAVILRDVVKALGAGAAQQPTQQPQSLDHAVGQFHQQQVAAAQPHG